MLRKYHLCVNTYGVITYGFQNVSKNSKISKKMFYKCNLKLQYILLIFFKFFNGAPKLLHILLFPNFGGGLCCVVKKKNRATFSKPVLWSTFGRQKQGKNSVYKQTRCYFVKSFFSRTQPR